jgi:hypothetical protein
MKKYIFPLFTVLILTVSCSSDDTNPFKVAKHQIGMLNDSTQVRDLKVIFAQDSIPYLEEDTRFSGRISTIGIYEKGGKQLLSITPRVASDSTATISSVRIMDPRFATDKNVSLASTFKDITANYKISKITNLINSVVVNVKELDASFTIDKNELPANMRFDMDMEIEAIQIPDDAKIKFFIVHF